MRTRSRIRYRKLERIHRQASQRIARTLSSDQRKILVLAGEGYEISEIARELALPPEYVHTFFTGMIQRLTHDGLLPSPDRRNLLIWATETGIIQ